MAVLDRADLPFPHSLPEFQRLFPDDAACAAYLEQARWGDGFACPHCGTAGEPFHFENRPEQDEGPAFRIADSVELGVAAPLGAADAMGQGPPFPPPAQR